MHPGARRDHRRLGQGNRWKRRLENLAEPKVWPDRSGEGRHPPLPGHRPRRAYSAPGIGCRDWVVRQFTSPGISSGRQGLNIAGSMILFEQALKKWPTIPISWGGMIRCRPARPDNLPILERSGQPPSSRLFRRPPARIPRGSALRRWVAHWSSVLDDEAYVDRRHARGGNPRGGAGW